MSHQSEPLKISFTLTSDTVKSLFDLVAAASGNDTEARKAQRRKESSEQAIYGKAGVPNNSHLLVSRSQASELLQLSISTIDRLKRDGLMPQPIRVGRATRWSRAELVAWVDAGCPECSELRQDSNMAGAVSAEGSRQLRSTKQRASKSQKENLRKGTRDDGPEDSKTKTPFHKFLISIGLDYGKLPAFTNGLIMELTELGIPSIHGWMYKGHELPTDAGERMKAKLLLKYPLDKFGLEDPADSSQ